MIVIFQTTLFILNYLIELLANTWKERNDSSELDSNQSESFDLYHQEEIGDGDCFYRDGKYIFNPPIFIQRYEAVCYILQQSPWKEKIKKVVDFGCSELRLFPYLKDIPGLNQILEIDIDEAVIFHGITRAAPLNTDYLFCTREEPLNVYILNGDITKYDDYLLGTDAVVAIEVIEHLNPDVHEKVITNIFKEIQPKISIFTTPNAEFNQLFSNEGFRHPDHKFEWNRKEFYNWAQKIIEEYPEYSVKFYAVGKGPTKLAKLGCCTQMAVFTRKAEFEVDISALLPKGIKNYKLIREYEYPVFVDKTTNEDKIINEITYALRFKIKEEKYYNPDSGTIDIPLSDLMGYISQWCTSEEQLSKILTDKGFEVKEINGCSFLIHCGEQNSNCSQDEGSLSDISSPELLKAESGIENWDGDYEN